MQWSDVVKVRDCFQKSLMEDIVKEAISNLTQFQSKLLPLVVSFTLSWKKISVA